MSEGKLTKEELREDPVITGLLRLKGWIQRQSTFLAIVLAVGIVAVAGVQIARRMAARGEQQAAVLLLEGEGQYTNGNPGEALARFQEAYERHRGSPSGKTALLRSGDMQLEMGSYQEAQAIYKRYVDTGPKDGLLRASALRGLAGALDSQGQHEEAARSYLEAARIPESPLRADDLISAGNAFFDAGKLNDAEEAYQRVIEGFPEHSRVRDAREGLEMARARAKSAQPQP